MDFANKRLEENFNAFSEIEKEDRAAWRPEDYMSRKSSISRYIREGIDGCRPDHTHDILILQRYLKLLLVICMGHGSIDEQVLGLNHEVTCLARLNQGVARPAGLQRCFDLLEEMKGQVKKEHAGQANNDSDGQ
ncbi:hypothetical protein GX51_05802 [Blastomyces parvus]|uniref:Uncharacterized protein n=1 Tax=Blastomyces parvus TaxID=2060905 RepID=A0A2B7WM08_9EURO|nr:hypothetical protein GX51_05802 [Blastomyces parvus]